MATSAFQTKLLGLQKNLLNFAYVLTSNRDDAYDLLQDTTLKALDNEDKYTENTNFKGWVFTIMRNIFINRYRHNTKFNAQLANADDIYNMPVTTSDSVSLAPEGSFAMQDLERAIDSFTVQYRKPFKMHLAGYQYAEIAEEMHLPVGTIKSRIYYARQKLRVMLKDYSS